MDIVAGLKNWISFRSMITPVILKLLYEFCFIVMNIIGLIAIIGVPLVMIIGGFSAKDNSNPLMTILMAVAVFIISIIVLILCNVFLRVYFEIVLVLFNIYDELKAINENTRSR